MIIISATPYSKLRDDLKYVADRFSKEGINYSAYNYGVQYNAADKSGIVHSFYPTTGTILFHESNDKENRNTKTIKNCDIDTFIMYLNFPNIIKIFFRKERK